MSSKSGVWRGGLKTFWLVVGVPVCLLWGLALVVRLQPQEGVLHDFVQEWCSARNYFEGEPIYLPLEQSVPLYFHGNYVGGVKVNAHPPASVLLAIPFGRLEYGAAFWAWNVVSLALLVPSLWLIMRPAGLDFSAWYLLPISVFLLVSNSLAQQVNQGQLNLVLLLLLAVAWSAMRREQFAISGAAVGLATAIKLFPGFLFLYFLAQRRWSAIVSGGIAFVALNGITAALFGWECFRDYVFEVTPQVGAFRDYWPNASITGFWSKLLDSSSGHVVMLFESHALARVGIVVCSIAIVSLAGWKCYRATTAADRDLAFGLCVIAMMLVSPITWDHYFLMLALPLAILWKRLPPSTANRIAILTALVVLVVLNPKHIWDATIPGDGELADDPSLTPSVAQPWHTLTVISYQFYALLALFVFTWQPQPAAASSLASTKLEQRETVAENNAN